MRKMNYFTKNLNYKKNNMMNIARNKVLSNSNLLSLRGGDEELVLCCVYFADNNELAYSGYSGTGDCEGMIIPTGMYAKECDEA